MLLNYDFFQTILLVLAYTLIYNLTSLLLFFTIMQIANVNLKTLYSFSHLSVSNVFTKILSLLILSLAGVPPLLGFFSKVFVFLLISNAKLFTLFLPLFTLLFSGLYFYIQNLRFLNSTNSAVEGPNLSLSFRTGTFYFLLSSPILFLVVFGFCYIDDLLIFSSWILL